MGCWGGRGVRGGWGAWVGGGGWGAGGGRGDRKWSRGDVCSVRL